MKATAIVAAFACVAVSTAGTAAAAPLCDPQLLRDVPVRTASAPNGTSFARSIEDVSAAEREAAIASQLLAGNIPSFLRQVSPVALTRSLPDGRRVQITVCVLPDYLAVGSDRDFLYVPMRLATALVVAARYGFTLPTTRLVDAIYLQSAEHLFPQPLPASDEMRSTDYYARHNRLISEQRAARGLDIGLLTSGHKKDLVLTNRLWSYSDRVAIYGWHRADGSAIQPLSTVHGYRYADYSHGVRLVSTTVYVNGEPRSIFSVLSDPVLASALSAEGPIRQPRELVAWAATPPDGDLGAVRPAITADRAATGAVRR